MPPTTPLPDRLTEHLRRGNVVAMAGAGVSAGPPTALPGWVALNGQIAAALGTRIDGYLDRPGATGPLVARIHEKRAANQFPPEYQAQILAEHAGEAYFGALQALDVAVRNPAHEGIAWLAKHGALAAVVTTNFDRLIEQALDAHGVRYLAAYEPEGYAACLRLLESDRDGAPLPVLKVHGSVEDRASLVDTLKQRLLGRNADLARGLTTLLREHLWLFGGFSAADLEDDPQYLELVGAAGESPGMVYVQWPGAARLSDGARRLLDAYAGKSDVITAELADVLAAAGDAVGAPPPPAPPPTEPGAAGEQVEAGLRAWAAGLHPAAAVNCLSAAAMASGDTASAFELLHRFWKDVLPADRDGPAFEAYRLQHGRLGMAGGLLSRVEDMGTTAGTESLQNLLRRGAGGGDPRAKALAGLAFLWAGETDMALPQLYGAGEALAGEIRVPAEDAVDVWQAIGEALYVLGEPEGFLNTWGRAADLAREAGDLPREAKLLALVALYAAEYLPDEYPAFMEEAAGPLLARAERLHDPAIEGFHALAEGRYATTQRRGAPALAALQRASAAFDAAGRPPWRIGAGIETAKALVDVGDVNGSAAALNALNQRVDRYQVWLPMLEEAKGQLYHAAGQIDDARAAFAAGVEYAEQMQLTRRADTLRQYLDLLG